MPPAETGRSGRSSDQVRRQLRDVLAPVVEAIGLDLEDITVQAAGRRSLLRVVVDADGGVDLDVVADVSRAISEALDGPAGDALPGPFVLEVSSPGVDRPLTEPRHWRRSIGRVVSVEASGKPLTGRILGTDDEAGVRLDVDGQERGVPWTDLGTGRVQVEFRRPDGDETTEGED